MKPPLKKGNPDDYQTPIEAINPLLSFIPKHWIIWECASGKGNLVKAFQNKKYSVIGTDILQGFDFLTWHPDEIDCIVTNPPYSLKQQFLTRAYELKKPFALLLPLTTFETKKRQDLFKKYGIEIILFDKRINFETPNKAENSNAWFATAWFTNGLNIGKQLTFVSYNDKNVRYKSLLED